MPRFVFVAYSSAMAAVVVSAQHHVDPFAGSGCNCTTFCDNECAINATAPTNTTLYRMTPFGVLDLSNKNTADIPGDVSFVVSRRTVAYECKKNPASFQCNSMVQFKGDDPNSTDLVLEMKVEVDGKWGPYLYCNDLNASDPLGEWACKTTLSPSGSVPGYPATCKADGFDPYPRLCFEGIPTKSEVVTDMGGCCSLATSVDAKYWSLNSTSMECKAYKYTFHYGTCEDGVSGVLESHEPTCNCTRVHQTVGAENLTVAFGHHGSSYHVAGGMWYSHPSDGECKDGHYVGDGSGCTYRHVETSNAINASCMYNKIDEAIEAQYPSCFAQCPPGNKTCDCYNECYTEASTQMTEEELTAPWTEAFGTGPKACPQVDLRKVDAPAYMKPPSQRY